MMPQYRYEFIGIHRRGKQLRCTGKRDTLDDLNHPMNWFSLVKFAQSKILAPIAD